MLGLWVCCHSHQTNKQESLGLDRWTSLLTCMWQLINWDSSRTLLKGFGRAFTMCKWCLSTAINKWMNLCLPLCGYLLTTKECIVNPWLRITKNWSSEIFCLGRNPLCFPGGWAGKGSKGEEFPRGHPQVTHVGQWVWVQLWLLAGLLLWDCKTYPSFMGTCWGHMDIG